MSQLLKIVIGAVAVIAIAITAIGKYNDTREEYQYRLAKQELRSEFLERSAAVRSIADSERYDAESRALFKWYFAELGKVYNRYPAYRVAEDQYLADLDARKAKGSMKDDVFEAHKASYAQIREIWDLLQSGKYAPVLTAGDASLRIDFLEFEPTTVGGQKGIKGRFVLWGAQRRRVEEKINGVTQARIDVQASFSDVQVNLFDEKGKPVAEMSFGMPDGNFVPYPEQRMEDFPPMAYIGTFSFPSVPFEAINAEIEGGARTRGPSGGELAANFKWKMPVPSNWKLSQGQVWEGATHEEREELAPSGARR